MANSTLYANKKNGAYYSKATTSNTSLANNTTVAVLTLSSLPDGAYFVVGHVKIPGSSSDTGYRRMTLKYTSDDSNFAYAQIGCAPTDTEFDVYGNCVIANSNSITLNVRQNSGSAKTISAGNAWIKAVRLV